MKNIRKNLLLSLTISVYCLVSIYANTIDLKKKAHKIKSNIQKKPDLKNINDNEIEKSLERKQKELQLRSLENSLKRIDFENKISRLKEEVEKLKLERELKESQLEAQLMEEKIKFKKQIIEQQKDIEKTRMSVEQLKLKYEESQQKLQILTFELEKKVKLESAEIDKKKLKLENKSLADNLDKLVFTKNIYLDNPLRKDNVLVISDRNIKLDGIITFVKANFVVDRINYFNNKDSKKPIFIIINYNFGGSVLAGARILKAMESSKAPIYVIVKSYAASMAAIIATLADKSFALPEAQILHHQPMLMAWHYKANTTEQEYMLKKFKKWSELFLGRVAKKMGISLKKLVKEMYKNSPNGDWEVFADEAKKLNWINKIISGIEYTDLKALPEKSNYTNHKLWKEYFDEEDDALSQVIMTKDKKGKTLINIYTLPGEFMFVKKDPQIIVY